MKRHITHILPDQVREVDTDLLSPSTLLSANYIVFVVLLTTFALVIVLVITGVVSNHYLLMIFLSFTNSELESEANPENNLMMRRAGISRHLKSTSWFL